MITPKDMYMKTSGTYATANAGRTLSKEQIAMLVVVEDTVLRFALDEIGILTNLPEIRESALLKSYCADARDVINSRIRNIRRVMGAENAEHYEGKLFDTVDMCDGMMDRLRGEIRAALVQKIGWQDIERASRIATSCGLLHAANRINQWHTGRRRTYDKAQRAIGEIDKKLACYLLNEDREPDMERSQEAFARLIDGLCKMCLKQFGVKANS